MAQAAGWRLIPAPTKDEALAEALELKADASFQSLLGSKLLGHRLLGMARAASLLHAEVFERSPAGARLGLTAYGDEVDGLLTVTEYEMLLGLGDGPGPGPGGGAA